MKISIHYKLLAVTTLLLLATALPVAYNAIRIFEVSARRNAEEQNLAQTIAKSKEMEQLILSYFEKGKALGTLIAASTRENLIQNTLATDSILSMDKDLLAVEVYQVTDGAPVFFRREAREERLKQYEVDSTYFDRLKKDDVLPFATVAQGQSIVRNATLVKNIPLVVLATPLSKNKMGLVDSFVVLYVQLSRFQSLMKTQSLRVMFVAEETGRSFLHSVESYALSRYDLRKHPTVQKALEDLSPKKQVRYPDPLNKTQVLSSFVRSNLGLIFVTEVSEKTILAPVIQVRRQAIYITGGVISLMLFLVFLFSMSLTNPIETLSELTLRIGRGDFSFKAKSLIKSGDEVGHLAQTIDTMVEGLQERDKVKVLFSKFHGSSITEDLLKSDVVLKGANKDVVVFFSDVRGFTAFSEGHTPEEVVEMLNEYFEIMVHIINENHGVVDKFIGDAIMAVWGAPKSTGRDSYWCVKACLEMRIALDELNKKRLARGHLPLMIGMGVHGGPVISGTIGSEERMEYTVIGDTVNQASRIEASTKAFGVDLLLSEGVASHLEGDFGIEFAGSAEVKGKTEALKYFRVTGFKNNETGFVSHVRTPYSEYAPEKVDKVKLVS